MEYLRYLTFHLIFFPVLIPMPPIPLLQRAVDMFNNSQDPETILMKISMLSIRKREKIQTLFLPIIKWLSVTRADSRQYISNKF